MDNSELKLNTHSVREKVVCQGSGCPVFGMPFDFSLQEKQTILSIYQDLRRIYISYTSEEEQVLIDQAFQVALFAHGNMRRKSGTPYILHPIRVAMIIASDIGLGCNSIIAALLHDVVEDTHRTLDELRLLFGNEVAKIVQGLTKVNKVLNDICSKQTANHKKILAFSNEVRVPIIKLADRLDNMRELAVLSQEKQRTISSETLYLYAPLAHRLGFGNIKNELEDLAMKYLNPHIYYEISSQVKMISVEADRMMAAFSKRIEEVLTKNNIRFRVTRRIKSIYSIWKKLDAYNISFDDIYDLIAMRVIIDAESLSLKDEKRVCWGAYVFITSLYQPHPSRVRDWITHPKSNGYESLHTTVMGPKGKWIEVQIRTERMHEIATRGVAAHWKYKKMKSKTSPFQISIDLEQWSEDVVKFVNQQELGDLGVVASSLASDDLHLFTEEGALIVLPKGVTVFDFAINKLGKEGLRCEYAWIDSKRVPLHYILKDGDQIFLSLGKEIVPNFEWTSYAVTPRSHQIIEKVLLPLKKKMRKEGEDRLKKWFKSFKINFSEENINACVFFCHKKYPFQLYESIAAGEISKPLLHNFSESIHRDNHYKHPPSTHLIAQSKNPKKQHILHYKQVAAPCCQPIMGEEVIGTRVHKELHIHTQQCSEYHKILATNPDESIQGTWFDPAHNFQVSLEIIVTDQPCVEQDILAHLTPYQPKNIHFTRGEYTMKVVTTIQVNHIEDLRQLERILKGEELVQSMQRIFEA